MSILYVVNIPRFFLSHRLPLAIAAQQAGYEVHVATSAEDTEGLERIRSYGFVLHPIPLEQHGTRPLGELWTIVALVRLLRHLRPDLVHLVTIKPVLYGGLAARLARRPAVVAAMSGLGRAFRDEHGQSRHPNRALVVALRLALPVRTTHLLLQNDDDRAVLTRLRVTTERTSTVIPGSGVDLEQFRPGPFEHLDAPVVFLYAGRLMWQKGLASYVAAAQRLSGEARFLVAGYSEPDSPDAVPMSQVEDWSRDGTIEWLGSRDDMPSVLAQSDVVVLPSTYGEGVPRTLIEAAASGRAIITTDTPGCRDICRDGRNGILIPPGDTDALEAAMRRLVRDPSERQRMGAAGRALAEDRFGLATILEQTLELYRSLLADLQ